MGPIYTPTQLSNLCEKHRFAQYCSLVSVPSIRKDVFELPDLVRPHSTFQHFETDDSGHATV